MAEDVEDLFGEKLVEVEDPKQAEWQDGVYTITGLSMGKGVYRSGRWEGRAYARFSYSLMQGESKLQVSQMLPWLPGKAFFEINFRFLTGLSLSEFNERCRAENISDASGQSKLFLQLFKGVEFEAEIRRHDKWLNVWEIKQRIENSQLPQTETEPAAEAVVDPATTAKLHDIAVSLNLDSSALEALSQEEFSKPLSGLSGSETVTLQELLEERLRDQQTPF